MNNFRKKLANKLFKLAAWVSPNPTIEDNTLIKNGKLKETK